MSDHEAGMRSNAPADIVIYKVGEGIVLKEKTLIAIDSKVPKVLAIGNEAEKIDTGPEGIECFSPFHFGKIENFSCAEKIMECFLKRAFGTAFMKPSLVLCFPGAAEEVVLKAYEDAMYCAGAKKVRLYAGTLNAFLHNISEKELKRYKGIVEITKDDPSEYAQELVYEAYECVKNWGLSKTQMLEMLNKMEE